MKYKIVVDSSADIRTLASVEFASAPLKINIGDRIYVDDADLDVMEMVEALRAYKGRTTTACPNTEEYLASFGDADRVFCITISSNLSGSFNAARLAKEQYEEENPGRKVHIIDSLSAGCELAMIAEKLREMIAEKIDFERMVEKITEYHNKLGTMFVLQSVHNLANNGRVSPAIAALVGMLGIRMVGKASDVGTLELTDKCRGDKRALAQLYKTMKEMGFAGGLVRIHHCANELNAKLLSDHILKDFPAAKIIVGKLGGLCSYYAEYGGMIIGFELA
ncbi:MAG: DegV family protein [Clostridia bacterium]|nr:DegV family protein [Clostridia bacterium]